MLNISFADEINDNLNSSLSSICNQVSEFENAISNRYVSDESDNTNDLTVFFNYLLKQNQENPNALNSSQKEYIMENLNTLSGYLANYRSFRGRDINRAQDILLQNAFEAMDRITEVLLAVPDENVSNSRMILERKLNAVIFPIHGANIRRGPGTGYSVIAALPKGTEVVITGKSGNWYKIIFSGSRTGYVYSSLLKILDEVNEPSSMNSTGTITANSGANVRKGPGTNYSIIIALKKGTQVKVIGITGNWYQIQLSSGIKGYIYKTLVNVSGSSNNNNNSGNNSNNNTGSTEPSGSNALKITESALGAVGQSTYVYGYHVYTSLTHYGKLACTAVVSAILLHVNALDKMYYANRYLWPHLQYDLHWQKVNIGHYHFGDIVFWAYGGSSTIKHVGIVVSKDVYGKWWTVDNSSKYLKVMKRPIDGGYGRVVVKSFRIPE